ncbi:hypothetical protein COCVIDRAFT_35055 [Bipolaris victoriae FI3]|uniref:Steroid 5-alpha reductase C-terminal domain-containing protein n=1 Tax=Bipolaris victoriae (strain FI3) TaxID=930091 RepID=W7ESP8_BIPV3|nr:hypothetical protein COCVIDRAFT_35055 [Bipolaris victoriae FI3]
MPGQRDSIEDPRSEASKREDIVPRGDYRSSPPGKLTFFVLRSLEPVLQYSILAHGFGTSVLHRVGLRTLPSGLPAQTVGSVVKQNIWVTTLSRDPMTVDAAVAIAMLNAASNSLSTYAFVTSVSSASNEGDFPQPALLIGSTLYVAGLLTELVAEIQRARFKADPNNKGKVCTGGLWSLARHINYGGYMMWRAGYAMAGGGYGLGALVAAFWAWDFSQRAIPVLSEYCEKRYGAQWESYRQKTPYKLNPYVY